MPPFAGTPRPAPLRVCARALGLAACLAACGDDTTQTGASTITSASTNATTSPTDPTTGEMTAGTSDDTTSTTDATTGSESGSDPTTSDPTTSAPTTSDPTTTSDPSTTGPDTDPTTGGDAIPGCVYEWDFTACPDGWEASKVDPMAPGEVSWECGEPGNIVEHGEAHPGVWATSLANDYNEEESSALVSPPFSLEDCAGTLVYLSFAHLYDFGVGDGGTVQISTDGGQGWTTVIPTWHGYCPGALDTDYTPPSGEPGFCDGDDELWTHTLVELDVGGEADVRVRFVFGSNGIIERAGWYIDAVRVEAYK
ncbi:MAG: hypothetical protein KC636_36635 [Myxococcales bacterium]|nr:hypothetical protein [Myxococcales bacterium]